MCKADGGLKITEMALLPSDFKRHFRGFTSRHPEDNP